MSNGLVKNNPVNDPDSKPIRNRSKFKPNMSLYQTLLFGLCSPSYAAEVVPSDERFSVRCKTDLDSMSLKSPFMSPVNMHRDYFFVPLRAILPLNADFIVTNPRTGEDVNPLLVNSVLSLPMRMDPNAFSPGFMIKQILSGCETIVRGTPTSFSDKSSALNCARMHMYFYTYQLLSPLFSRGSLLSALGMNLSTCVYGGAYYDDTGFHSISLDKMYELVFARFRQYLTKFDAVFYTPQKYDASKPQGFIRYTVSTALNFRDDRHSTSEAGNVTSPTSISFRQFIEYLKENALAGIGNYVLKSGVNEETFSSSSFYLYDPTKAFNYTANSYLIPQLASGVGANNPLTSQVDYADPYSLLDNRTINLQRLVAYQLACAQFYTSDAVDYVYNVELWHQNMLTLASRCSEDITLPGTSYASGGLSFKDFETYQLNGVTMRYDSVSGNIVNFVLSNLFGDRGNAQIFSSISYQSFDFFEVPSHEGIYNFVPVTNNQVNAFAYYTNLFNPQRSLRFRDYFVGSKVAPLAVGDVNVSVNSDKVNVVDVTKNIQLQRFLNQVNRIGRTLKEYSRGIFGQTPMSDPHECIWLGTTTDVIGGEETKNTGAAQLTEPQTITTQLRSNSSRFAFEFDVPEFGTIVAITTFDVPRPYINANDRTFFHIDRFDMFNPYLQHIGDQPVLGREIDFTQSSTFGYQMRYMEYKQRIDRATGGFIDFLPGYAFLADDYAHGLGTTRSALHISPDFIRSRPYEFDDFYISLPNVTSAGYFHFITRQDYEVSASRPMEAAPTIL